MKKNNTIIKKSHDLVNAKYNLTIWEDRIVTMLLSFIRKDDTDFKKYYFDVPDFVERFNISHKDVHKELRKAMDGLLKKIVVITSNINGKIKIFKTTFISSFEYYQDGTGKISASFRPELKPFLLELKGKFLMYEMRNILKMPVPTRRIYERLKQYETIGSRTLSVTEMKSMLDVEDKYARYYNFKLKVILPAQKRLSKYSDICFTFEEIRKYGKAVDSLRFSISKNQQVQPKKAEKKSASPKEAAQDEYLVNLKTSFKKDKQLRLTQVKA